MSVLQRKCIVLLGSAMTVMLAVFLIVNTANAASVWLGTTDNLLDANNWIPNGVPGNTIDAEFYSNGSHTPTLASGWNPKYIGFNENSNYTFSGAGKITIGTTGSSGNIDTQAATGEVVFNNTGGILLNRASVIYASSGGNGTANITINCPLQMGGGGSSGSTVYLYARGGNITVNSAAGLDMSASTINRTLTLKANPGKTITLANGVKPTTRLPRINVDTFDDQPSGSVGGKVVLGDSTTWAGFVIIYNADLEITSNTSLGAAGTLGPSLTGWTEFTNGDNLGALILKNGITTNETILFNERDNNAAEVKSQGGHNILSGALGGEGDNTGGTLYTLESSGTNPGDLLEISGTINPTSYGTGAHTINLQGEGNGLVSGQILANNIVTDNATGDGGTLAVNVAGPGTWEFTNVNTYTGPTDVNGGTMKLSGSGSIADSPLITVHSYSAQPPCILDVADVTGGFTLAGTQTLRGSGHVVGNVTTSAGSVLNPGINQGTLHFDNAPSQTNTLSLVGGTKLNFDLSSTPAGPKDLIAVEGNLSLAGTSNLVINYLDGFLTNGTYQLFTYGGSLSGNGSNISAPLPAIANESRLVYTVKTGNDAGGTANQVNLIVSGLQNYTWRNSVASYDWELHGAAINWNSTDGLFYNMDSVTFDNTGANAFSVNLAASVSPLNLTFTNNAGHNYTFEGYGDLQVISTLAVTGTGKATIANYATTNTFGAIDLASGTLAFAQPYGYDYTLTTPVTGTAELRQEGTNVLTLGVDNSAFAGTISIANGGTIKAGADNALGGAGTVVNIEDGGTLDVNALNLGDTVVHVQGAGVGGYVGAITNTNIGGGYQFQALKNVVVTGSSVTFDNSGSDEYDIRGGYLQGSAGTYTLTKTGAAPISLATMTIDNNLGDINIQGGVLYFEDTTDSMGDPTKTINIDYGTTLSLWYVNHTFDKKVVVNGGTFEAVGGATFAGPIDIASDSKIHVANYYFDVTGPITGANIVKDGNYELRLDSNDNTFGSLEIQEDWVSVGNGGTTGSLGTGDVIFNGGYELEFQRNDTYTVSNRITGAVGGQIEFNADGGVVTLSGNSDYSGPTNIYHGTVVLQSSYALGATGADNYTYLRINTSGSNRGHLVLDGSGGDLNVAEDFTTSGFGTAPDGSGFWYGCNGLINNLAGNNILSGTISLTSGGGSTMIKVDGGTLTLSGTVTNKSSGRDLILAGDADGFVTGVIQNGSGTTHNTGVVKVGNGTWTLNNAMTYTGDTEIYAGTLAIVNYYEYFINNQSAAITVHAGATLDTTQSSSGGYYQMGWDNGQNTTPVPQALYGTGTVKGGIRTSPVATISPSGPLPAGTMTISGGDLMLVGGGDTLQFKLGDAGNDQIVVNQVLGVGGTLDTSLLGSGITTKISIIPNGTLAAGTYTLVNALTQSATGGVYFDVSAADAVMRQSLSIDNSTSGDVKLVVTGSVGNLTWSGATSAWDVVNSANWNSGTELFYQGDAVTFNDSASTGAVSVDATVYPASITVNNDALAYDFTGTGNISSGTSITKTGPGTMTLTNTSCDFTGQVNILGGVFKLGADPDTGAIGRADGKTVINGGTLDVNGYSVYLEPIEMSGAGAGSNGAGQYRRH